MYPDGLKRYSVPESSIFSNQRSPFAKMRSHRLSEPGIYPWRRIGFSREDTLYDRNEVVSHHGGDFAVAVLQSDEDSSSQFGDIWLGPISILSQLFGDYFYRPRVPTNVIQEETGAGIVVENFIVAILPSRHI